MKKFPYAPHGETRIRRWRALTGYLKLVAKITTSELISKKKITNVKRENYRFFPYFCKRNESYMAYYLKNLHFFNLLWQHAREGQLPFFYKRQKIMGLSLLFGLLVVLFLTCATFWVKQVPGTCFTNQTIEKLSADFRYYKMFFGKMSFYRLQSQ